METSKEELQSLNEESTTFNAKLQGRIDELSPIECEVEDKEGLYYLMRMRPYRTVNNVIDGVVITFEDVTRIKKSEERSRRPAKDGRKLDVWLTVTKLMDREGQPMAVATTERDISNIKPVRKRPKN